MYIVFVLIRFHDEMKLLVLCTFSINTVYKSIELLTDFVSEIVTENKSDSCAALNI
jgi:hypothetical protein